MVSTPVVSKRTILLVDDDESIRMFLSEILTGSGFHVLCAADAQQALRAAAEYREEIDLLVSDIQMPPGMNGIDLADRLHRERPQMKIILMSGVGAERSFRQEGWDFLRKPFPAEALKREIRSLLGQELVHS